MHPKAKKAMWLLGALVGVVVLSTAIAVVAYEYGYAQASINLGALGEASRILEYRVMWEKACEGREPVRRWLIDRVDSQMDLIRLTIPLVGERDEAERHLRFWLREGNKLRRVLSEQKEPEQ